MKFGRGAQCRSRLNSALWPCCCQIHQIIYKEAPGQFNPTGRHGKVLSLPIFTLSLIQTSSFLLQSHNAGLCSFFFMFSYIFSLYGCHPPNPSDSMQFMQMISLSCSKLNETSTKSLPCSPRHTHTHTHTERLSVKICSSISFAFEFPFFKI